MCDHAFTQLRGLRSRPKRLSLHTYLYVFRAVRTVGTREAVFHGSGVLVWAISERVKFVVSLLRTSAGKAGIDNGFACASGCIGRKPTAEEIWMLDRAAIRRGINIVDSVRVKYLPTWKNSFVKRLM